MQTGSLWCGERCVALCVLRTTSPWERMAGLLGRRALPAGQGLLIVPCGAVHTVGMRFPLDLVFLDAAGRVLRSVPGVPPGRFGVWGGGRARQTLEVQAGWLDLAALNGARLDWRPASPP
jgi:uncharacterized membrane protein (UPF0127 family)